MRFLLDACAAFRRMQDALAAQGHDVLSALERNPRATDEELMALAMEERRILVTEDKDFGELVFVRRLPHPCIVRFVEMTAAARRTRSPRSTTWPKPARRLPVSLAQPCPLSFSQRTAPRCRTRRAWR